MDVIPGNIFGFHEICHKEIFPKTDRNKLTSNFHLSECFNILSCDLSKS